MNLIVRACCICFFLAAASVSSEAAVIKVTPANVQAAIDALPDSTPESSKPKSLQAIVEDSTTYAGDEDALDFAPGTYDDIGELVLKSPLTLRKDPATEGDVVITGELLIQIRSKDVKIEGLVFRDIEIGQLTVLGRGETSSKPSRHRLNGPIEFYFNGVTISSFLLARKALTAPADRPDAGHDYSSYTGQLTQAALDEHISAYNTESTGRLYYKPHRLISNKDGFPINGDGNATRWDSVAGKWYVFYTEQPTVDDHIAHILINPRYYGAEDSCPDSGNLTGIEIARNTFERTQITAVRSIPATASAGSQAFFPGDKNCFMEVEVTGNTFRNIGIGGDFSYLRDSRGDFITDGDGKRIPHTYGDPAEYAIGLFDRVRKAAISDNTIEGTTHTPIVIRSTPEGGRITVSNNVIRPAPDEGAIFPRFQESQIDIRGNADDVKITITGNRLLGSDDHYPYFVTHFNQFKRRADRWCRDPEVPSAATIAQLETLLQPRIWRSYVPDFPYPEGNGAPVRLPPQGPPVSLTDLLNGFSGTTAQPKTNIVISDYDVVRHKRCHPTSRIEIRSQKGVSVTDNDLGYGEEGSVKYAITLWEADTTLAEFSGNNVDYYSKGVIGSFNGNAATVAAKGNYLGLRPILSNLNGDGAVAEPIARGEGDIGPRPGMTAENPPEVPRVRSAAVSSSRNMIVLTYSAALDGESEPPAAAFTVRYRVDEGIDKGRTGIVRVDDVEVDGSTVTLTLEKEIPSGASGLTVVYSSEAAGDSAVRSMLGGLDARDGEVTVDDPDEGDMMPTGPGETGAKGDGGCALASSGSEGAGLAALLLAIFGFAVGSSRKNKKDAS